MNGAPTPQIETLQEEIDAAQSAREYHEQTAEAAARQAEQAEEQRVAAELRRTELAARAAAIGVNAAVTLVDQVAAPSKNRAGTAASRYDTSADTDTTAIQEKVKDMTRVDVAPYWRIAFLGDSDSPAVKQASEYDGRLQYARFDEPKIQDHGMIVGRIARTIRGGVHSQREAARRQAAETQIEISPHSGTLLAKLDPTLVPKGKQREGTYARNVSEAVALGVDSIRQQVDYMTSDSGRQAGITRDEYIDKLRSSTPAALRAEAVTTVGRELNATPQDTDPTYADLQGNAIDADEVVHEHLSREDSRLAREGSLLYKIAFGQEVGPDERTAISAELGAIAKRLQVDDLETKDPVGKQQLEERRDFLLLAQGTGRDTLTSEDVIQYRERFLEVARQQLGTMAMRHAVLGGETFATRHRTEAQHEHQIIQRDADGNEEVVTKVGLREQRQRILDEIKASQFDTYTPPGFDPKRYAGKNAAERATAKARRVQQRRAELREQLGPISQQLESARQSEVGWTNPYIPDPSTEKGLHHVNLADAHAPILPVERTFIPQLVAAATLPEEWRRRDIGDQVDRAVEAKEEYDERIQTARTHSREAIRQAAIKAAAERRLASLSPSPTS